MYTFVCGWVLIRGWAYNFTLKGLQFLIFIVDIFILYCHFTLGGLKMGKKHFLCTHTWTNEQARDQFLNIIGQMTDREYLAAVSTEQAELLQTWLGQDDFFSVIGLRIRKRLYILRLNCLELMN